MIWNIQKRPVLRNFILDEVVRHCIISNDELIRIYNWRYTAFWDVVSKTKRGDSLMRQMRRMAQKGEIVEERREKKGNGWEIFYTPNYVLGAAKVKNI